MKDQYHVMHTSWDVHWQAWVTLQHRPRYQDFIVCIEHEKTYTDLPSGRKHQRHRVTVVQQARELIYDKLWSPEDIDEIKKDPITWLRLIRL